jgi:hypothetical protein
MGQARISWDIHAMDYLKYFHGLLKVSLGHTLPNYSTPVGGQPHRDGQRAGGLQPSYYLRLADPEKKGRFYNDSGSAKSLALLLQFDPRNSRSIIQFGL